MLVRDRALGRGAVGAADVDRAALLLLEARGRGGRGEREGTEDERLEADHCK